MLYGCLQMGHTGVFLQKLKCVSEESSFFLIIKNGTKCYEGPSKQKKNKKTNKHKNKKHQKKTSPHYHLQNYHCFFRNLFQKNKNITSKNPKTVPNVIMSP